MTLLTDVVDGAACTWTAVYTLGLPAAQKEARRAELQSDLWDQQHFALLQHEPAGQTAMHVCLRILLGVPGDIAWRAEAAFSKREERTLQMPESALRRVGLLFGVLIALFPVVFGLSFVVRAAFGTNEGESVAGWLVWGIIMLVAGGAMIAGLIQSPRSYKRGMTLVSVGAVVFCLSTFWMAFLSVPIGVAVAVLAHLRGRRPNEPEKGAIA